MLTDPRAPRGCRYNRGSTSLERTKPRMKSFTAKFLLLLVFPLALVAQSLQDFEKRVTEFTLANGLHFIVLERHEAPVVSFHTYVNAGSVDDPGGETGLAHMFEHMAFKGTETIGTKNWPAREARPWTTVERVYDQLDAERNKGLPRRSRQGCGAAEAAQDRHREGRYSYVIPNALSAHHRGKRRRRHERRHRRGLHRLFLQLSRATARAVVPVWNRSASRIRFSASFIKSATWCAKSAACAWNPSPQGKLMEALLATAFEAHPYRNMPGGWASDIENFRVPEAEPVLQKILRARPTSPSPSRATWTPRSAGAWPSKYFSILPSEPAAQRSPHH